MQDTVNTCGRRQSKANEPSDRFPLSFFSFQISEVGSSSDVLSENLPNAGSSVQSFTNLNIPEAPSG